MIVLTLKGSFNGIAREAYDTVLLIRQSLYSPTPKRKIHLKRLVETRFSQTLNARLRV